MSPKKKLTYEAAYQELENILLQLQEEEVNMENLPKLIQRANELVNFCREKLRTVEKEIEQLLDEDE